MHLIKAAIVMPLSLSSVVSSFEKTGKAMPVIFLYPYTSYQTLD
jgi:hypothetical protein